MEQNQIEQIFSNTTPLAETNEDQEVLLDLAGYQVTKAELFSHSREPAITIWETRIKFNMACLRKFPGVTHIDNCCPVVAVLLIALAVLRLSPVFLLV